MKVPPEDSEETCGGENRMGGMLEGAGSPASQASDMLISTCGQTLVSSACPLPWHRH